MFLAKIFGGDGIGKVADAAGKIFGKMVKDKDLHAKLMAEVDMQTATNELAEFMGTLGIEEAILEIEAEAVKGVAAQNLADAKSNDKWQRRWRPLCNVLLVLCLIWVMCVLPIFRWAQMVWFPETPLMPESEYTMYLIVGDFAILGVNFGSRTLEKLRNAAPF
jgi:hypothetical protein